MRSKHVTVAVMVFGLCLATLAGGCQVFGFFASAIPQSVDAQYEGLANQKVAVMIWADRGIRVDFPNLQLDMGNAIQSFLLAKTGEGSLEKAQFPYEARSVIRFQKEHPDLEGRSVTEWAHRVGGVTRLVFVEVPEFSTRAGSAVQLLKGGVTCNVKVVEIADGKAKIAYERQNVRSSFPPHSPEGVLDLPESTVYAGTVNSVSRDIAELFYPHVIED